MPVESLGDRCTMSFAVERCKPRRAFLVHRAEAAGDCDWADLMPAEIPAYDFAFTQHRAAVGVNYDSADDTENGRIQLCIYAGSRRTLRKWGRPLGRRSLPSGRSRKVPARCARGRPGRDRSCSFRVIREIAVPQAAAQGCVNAEPACHSERSRGMTPIRQFCSSSAQSQFPPAQAR